MNEQMLGMLLVSVEQDNCKPPLKRYMFREVFYLLNFSMYLIISVMIMVMVYMRYTLNQDVLNLKKRMLINNGISWDNLISPWVYMLFSNQYLVYVWSSKCMVKRIVDHVGAKDFDSIILYKTYDYVNKELEMITKYNPIMNVKSSSWTWWYTYWCIDELKSDNAVIISCNYKQH